MSERKYLEVAEELRGNEGQWKAYESKGHCVVLAGPGSGKTKTLTLKLARILAEDVDAPRGVACITYNNECAREVEDRLDQIGIAAGDRAFIGTVHSFSLTQILLPYAKVAKLGLPDGFRVATKYEMRAALEEAHKEVIGGPGNPRNVGMSMGIYRRMFLDRSIPEWKGRDGQMASLIESYESALRKCGVIDFDDMPLLAVRALRENLWLRRAILAKYPVLAVDEYQDLGSALDGMVRGLCFSTGIRLFAVGDVDQSIYGFTGANPALLDRLSKRPDIELVHLRLNYRCGSTIIAASSYALGEDREYAAPDGAEQGTVFFHPRAGGYAEYANDLFATILPQAQKRMPQLRNADVAILYPTAQIGDAVVAAAERYGYSTIRTDGNALYPRSSLVMRWLEACASWCCGGWRDGRPRFAKIMRGARSLFREVLTTEDAKLEYQRALIEFLWNHREGDTRLGDWIAQMRSTLIDPWAASCRSIQEDLENLSTFKKRVDVGGEKSEMTLVEFAGQGIAADKINLSTLHSAKGREFQLVVLFATDQGRIPWNNVGPGQVRESRRLFYVGFTRAESEIHMMYSEASPSVFVTEVKARLDAG